MKVKYYKNRFIFLKLFDFNIDLNLVSDGQPTLVFEPTEVDYLKRIILAYMTGTDQIVC